MQPITDQIRARGVPQHVVGRITGLSQRAVSDRMTGRTRWHLTDVVLLAEAWGVTTDDILGRAR